VSSSLCRTNLYARLRWARMAQAGLVGFIIAAGLALQALSLNLDSAIVPASALVSLVVLWSYYSWHLLGRRWFGPYGLFLLSASLFNGGQAFLELLRLNPNGVLGGAFSPELTVKALYLVALGLSALHLGALWAVDTARRNGEVRASGSDEERSRATRLVGWSCIAISAIPMAMVIEDMLSTVASRGYAGLYGRAAADILPSTIRIFATAMIPGIMFLAAGGQKRRFLIASVWILVMGNSAILMLSGLRSGAALLLISFAWLYDARIRRLSRSILLSVGVGMLAVFAIVGVAREYQVSWRESLGTKPLENPLVAAISEMGGTLGTVAHTINLFPSVRPFDDGVGYVYAISAVLPNVGWDSHPAQAHGSYGEWLVRTVDGRTADLGQGLGFSFIAEPFANFGWYGVAPVLGLLGYLLVKMTDWATLTGDPARYAAVATFLMSLLFFARGESASVFRPFVYYSVLPYAAVCMICQRRLRALHYSGIEWSRHKRSRIGLAGQRI
jgi:oligosaccharide repeat unit polymerase